MINWFALPRREVDRAVLENKDERESTLDGR
jgi:hypothetical protein